MSRGAERRADETTDKTTSLTRYSSTPTSRPTARLVSTCSCALLSARLRARRLASRRVALRCQFTCRSCALLLSVKTDARRPTYGTRQRHATRPAAASAVKQASGSLLALPRLVHSVQFLPPRPPPARAMPLSSHSFLLLSPPSNPHAERVWTGDGGGRT